MKTEKQVQTEILKYLKAEGCYVVKTIITNNTGTPDILACYNGKFIAIEVKRQPLGINAASPKQIHHIAKIIDAGGYAIVTSNIEDVKKIIKTIKL